MAETTGEKVYKTPEYTRRALKKYYTTHKMDINKKNLEYYYKKMESASAEECIRKRKAYQKRNYEKKKAKGITQEDKEARAKYMREYRARKKLEKENNPKD
jgi:hypothetical protein